MNKAPSITKERALAILEPYIGCDAKMADRNFLILLGFTENSLKSEREKKIIRQARGLYQRAIIESACNIARMNDAELDTLNGLMGISDDA